MQDLKPYEILESISEHKLKVVATSREQLFKNALIAMFESISPSYVKNAKSIAHRITLTASDKELLLIDFLTEALFFSDRNNEAFFDVRFHALTDTILDVDIIGKKVENFAIEIKAVTHHDVHIEEKNGTLSTNILFDI